MVELVVRGWGRVEPSVGAIGGRMSRVERAAAAAAAAVAVVVIVK